METVRDFIYLDSKITADGDCSHEIKRCLLLGRKKNTWRVNKTFLNNQQIIEEIKREKKFLEPNDNENMTTQNIG